MVITIMGQSAHAMNEGIGGRRALRAGILLGLIAGFADAIAVLIENPNSFTGLRSPAAFVGASAAMHLVLGVALGGLLVLVGMARRISATTFFAHWLRPIPVLVGRDPRSRALVLRRAADLDEEPAGVCGRVGCIDRFWPFDV